MERCNTCKHWAQLKDDRNFISGTGVCNAANEIWNVTEFRGGQMRLKKNCVDLLHFVEDGSEYSATLLTMGNFGCVAHSSHNNQQTEGA